MSNETVIKTINVSRVDYGDLKGTYRIEVSLETGWSREIKLSLSDEAKERILDAIKPDIQAAMGKMVDSIQASVVYETQPVLEHSIPEPIAPVPAPDPLDDDIPF